MRNRNTVRTPRELWCSKMIERPTDASLLLITVNNIRVERAINAQYVLHSYEVSTVMLQ